MCRSLEQGGRRCPRCSPEGRRLSRAQARAAAAADGIRTFIGVTPYRPESAELMRLSSRPSYYDTDEWAEFDETIHAAAERHNLELVHEAPADGLWQGDTEPAGAYEVRAENFDDVKAWAAEIAGRYDQDSVMVGYYDESADGRVYSVAVGDAPTSAVLRTLRQAGLDGGRVTDGRLEIASPGAPLPAEAQRVLAARYGGVDVDRAHIEFVEKDDSHLAHTPIKAIQMLRQNYCDQHGIPPRQRIPHLTSADDIAAARVYEQGEHQPDHPKIQRSYRVFRQHVAQQWDMLTAAGYRFEPWHGETEQPYANSAEMLSDLRDHKRLYYFRTEVSQDSEGALPPDHPMAKPVTVTMPDGSRRRMVANDVFRAVHDAIAHSEGHQFGPYGEKRAWWTHRSSLPSEARLALWNETRAQNAWTNAGPHMQTRSADGSVRVKRRGDVDYIPQVERPYAQQKCVLPPNAEAFI